MSQKNVPQMNILDTLIYEVDSALRTLFPPAKRMSTRPSPTEQLSDTQLTSKEKNMLPGLCVSIMQEKFVPKPCTKVKR